MMSGDSIHHAICSSSDESMKSQGIQGKLKQEQALDRPWLDHRHVGAEIACDILVVASNQISSARTDI